ncbi:MAG: PBP1A family penicillin-binding protein [Candidatus Nealsonbacteria bacterium]|nr:MAG: PBP1A family penicillin-binding protein [Candidatus Nealsonbacteria bacterium]
MAERKYYRKTYQKTKKGGFYLPRSIPKGLLWGFLFFIFCLLFVFVYYAKDLPRPEKFAERQLVQSTKIYDRSGEVILYEIYGEEKRTAVSLEAVPEYVRQAVIVAEDANFYHHFGIDLKAIARSILINLKIMKPIYGGSTIPQQLIRSTFFSPEKTAERKTREIVLALELDRRYSKDQILEWYLNQVPFGQNAYGIEAASQTYFRKSVSEISLGEAATLAALIQAPSRLSPYGENKDKLLARKNYILGQTVVKGFFTPAEIEEVKKEEINFVEKRIQIKAPYFTLWVKQQLEEKYGEDFLREKGLKVYTSLDWEVQKIAEEVVRKGVERNKAYNAHNAALVAIEPKTGQIIAMTVGTGDYYASPYPEGCTPGVNCLFDPQFNVAIGTKKGPGRQPGSAFKPFVYATAFKKGYDDKTTVIDEETNFGVWGGEEYTPKNYDEKFRGEVTLREALAQSINVPSVKVLLNFADSPENFKLGKEPDSIKTAKDLGITTLNPPYGPSIVLGGWEVKLLEMVSAYGVFATDGLRIEPILILKIEDSTGDIIEENKKTPKRVLDKNPARLINDILSDNEARAPLFGWHSALYFEGYQVAVKTGTTQNYRDAWTIGYAPSVVAGIWVGNNDNSPTAKKSGVMLSAPIFHNFMEKVLPEYPKENFEKPKITGAVSSP